MQRLFFYQFNPHPVWRKNMLLFMGLSTIYTLINLIHTGKQIPDSSNPS